MKTLLLALSISFAANCIVAQEPKSRLFKFEYGATINDVPSGSKIRVWIPIATSSSNQAVEILSKTFPAEVKRTQDDQYGNQMYYFELTSRGDGPIAFNVVYSINRSEVRSLTGGDRGKWKLLKEEAALFLRANAKVPTTGKAIELFDSFAKAEGETIGQARMVYDWVDSHMSYDKSKPGYGNGDVLWACDSKTGNCTDFHSLFISVARNKKVPAKFEIGFPLPPERGAGSVGGYHCWAKFFTDDRGWIPVDISEADKHPEMTEYYFGNLTENRVHFSTGRDIVLEPKQDAAPLNYFVYPHVEVGGKVWPKEKVELSMRYQDKS